MTIKWEFENRGKRYGSQIEDLSIPESIEGVDDIINIVSKQMKLSLSTILFGKNEFDILQEKVEKSYKK